MAPKGGIPWGCKNCVEPLQALSSGLGKLQGAHFQGKFGVWVLQGIPFFHHTPTRTPNLGAPCRFSPGYPKSQVRKGGNGDPVGVQWVLGQLGGLLRIDLDIWG